MGGLIIVDYDGCTTVEWYILVVCDLALFGVRAILGSGHFDLFGSAWFSVMS